MIVTNADKIIGDLPRALINWYNFKEGSKALFISGGRPECEVLFDVLKERKLKVSAISVSKLEELDASTPGYKVQFDGNSWKEKEAIEPGEGDLTEEESFPTGRFDYIVAAGIIERNKRPEELLTKLKHLLKPSGSLLIGAENRLGLRYFCGDKETFTGHVLDGLDDYNKVSRQRMKAIGARAYSKAEYERMVIGAGFKNHKFYSILPVLECPQVLISEKYLPNESMDVRVFPQYKSPETIFLEEERLYAALIENQMFHQMANGFLIEASMEGNVSDWDQITVQEDRGHEEALATMIKNRKEVLKKALYLEGQHKIDTLFQNTEYLRQHGIPVAEAGLKNGIFAMPYIEGQIGTEYFRELLRQNGWQAFVQELELFRQMILKSSEHVPYDEVNWRQFEPWWERRKKDDPNIDQWEKKAFGTEEEKKDIGVILKKGFLDMVSINCFRTEKGIIFFDQEFFVENFPANSIFIRTVDFIYRDNPDLESLYPKENILDYFHLSKHQKIWRNKGNEFLEKLRNDKVLSEYHKRYRKDNRTITANRHRMDYSQEEYEKLFTNIFKGIGRKKIYLFGSGRYAEQFVEQFGKYYEIVGIVDNQEARWGEKLSGIEITSPAVLKEEESPFKVFICIKFFDEVLLQLKNMGIKDISVYDPRLEYERPLKPVSCQETTEPKKYHVGYVAGVFDLFHIGHLNLIRRAKEQCDYLIVGVVSDEQVIKSKKTRPYIPFEERLEIVQACRYVDEAVKIPEDRPNTEDAYHMYHFDVQFSGSDYENDPDWLARKVFLQQHGADMVFFPYTETTSSTEIKNQIRGEDVT